MAPTKIKFTLDGLLESIAQDLFSCTREEAWKAGVCISCKKYWKPRTHTPAGHKEYAQSALCEECFDNLPGE